MKRFVFFLRCACVTCFFSFSCLADDSVWSFSEVRLIDICKVVFTQILGQSFAADDELVRDQKRLTIDLKRTDANETILLLTDLLETSGYELYRFRDTVWRVRKITETLKEERNVSLIYEPRFRSVDYILDVLGLGKFRGVTGSVSGAPSERTSSDQAGQTNQQKTFSNNSASQFVGKSADVIYIRDTRSAVERIRKDIEAVDVPAWTVEVTGTVYEYQSNGREATAISAIANLAQNRVQVGRASGQSIADFLRIESASFQLLLDLLSSDSRFSLVASPNLRVVSGSVGRVNVGASVPTLSATTQGNGNVTQSIQYQNTGFTIELRPLVKGDSIFMSVRQNLSDAVITTTGVNNSPTITNREITTDAEFIDDSFLLLAGLISTRSSKMRNGFSFLPDFFKSTSSQDDKTEIVLFLRVKRVPRPV